MSRLFKKKSSLPEYLTHYGMHRAPFSAAIEDDMYYAEPTRAQRLDILLHLTQYANELLLITGEEGSGKTTLLGQFLKKAKANWKICRIDAYPMMHEEQVLQRIYNGFSVPMEDNATHSALSTLKRHIDAALVNTPTMVLIVDNVHVLPINVIGLLLDIANTRNLNTGKGLRTLFFCEPQIKILLADPELQDKLKQPQRKIDLPHFDEDHTGNYLRHRLSQAGMVAERFLTDSTITKIHKQSLGIPGRINETADKLLFETTPIIRRTANGKKRQTTPQQKRATATPQQENAKDNDNPAKPRSNIREHYVVAAAVTGLIMAILLFQSEINDLFHTKPDSKTLIVDHQEQHTTTSLTLPTPGTTQQPPPAKIIQGTLPSSPINTADANTQAQTPVAITAPQTKAPAPTIQLPKSNSADHLTTDAVPDDTVPKKTNTAKTQIKPLTQARIDNTSTSRPAMENKPAAPGLKSEPWLLTQNPDHYTLQLVAGHHKSTVIKFIDQYRLATPELSYFYSRRNGKNWHNLLHGIYPDRKSAANAIKSLPLPLTEIKPWIRSIESIQIDIYRAQQ